MFFKLKIMSISQLANKLSIFKNLNTEQKAYLFKLLEEKVYKKGEFILKEGAHDRNLFIIHTGSVRVLKETEFGETIEIAFLSHGNYFGEFSLIDYQPRSASVQAFDDSVIYKLDYLSFSDICRKFPEVEIYMLRGFLLDTVSKLRTSTVDQAITQGILYGL